MMKDFLARKAYGFWVVVLALAAAVISLVRYIGWAPAHNALNVLVILSLIIGIIPNIASLVIDEDLILVAVTACYAFAAFRHLADQVGSFVDAFQGINMFGDASQVGNIVSIGICMVCGTLLAIVSGFLKREK